MSTICKLVCLLFLQTMMFLSKKSFWISLTYCRISFLPHKLLHDWNEMDEIYYRRKFHDFRELFCWWSQSDGKSLVASMNYVMSLSAHPEMPWEFKKRQNLCHLLNYFCAGRLMGLAYSISSIPFLPVLYSSPSYFKKIWLQISR